MLSRHLARQKAKNLIKRSEQPAAFGEQTHRSASRRAPGTEQGVTERCGQPGSSVNPKRMGMEEFKPCQQPVPFLESPLDVRSIPGMRSRGWSLQGEQQPVGGSPGPKHHQKLPERCSVEKLEIFLISSLFPSSTTSVGPFQGIPRWSRDGGSRKLLLSNISSSLNNRFKFWLPPEAKRWRWVGLESPGLALLFKIVGLGCQSRAQHEQGGS